MATTRYATVHYRRLASAGDLSGSLVDAIANALAATVNGVRYGDSWQQRVETLPTDPPQSRFINNVHTDGATAFGTLCAYTEAQMQALIDTSAAAPNVNISDARPPHGNDYLHGIAYWLVVGDHCYLVQHPRVTSKTLEDYLTWLFRKTSQVDTQAVVLRSEFDIASVGGDPEDVVDLQVGGIAPEPPEQTGRMTEREIVERRSLEEVTPRFSAAKKVIESVFGELGANRIMNDVPPGAALEVTVNIGYRAKRRKMDRSTLKDIGTQLRNLGDGEVKIRGRTGSVHGEDARLHMKMPFKLIRQNGSLLDLEDARSQLRKVHERLLEDGKIVDRESRR